METQDIMNIGIGTKESPKLKPTKVKILGVAVQTKTKEGKIMKSPLANILVKHPDKEEPVKITKVKIIKGDSVEVVSLWVSLDEDGKFQKSSAISELLNFLKVGSLNDVAGKEVELVEQSKEDTYLCIKAY